MGLTTGRARRSEEGGEDEERSDGSARRRKQGRAQRKAALGVTRDSTKDKREIN